MSQVTYTTEKKVKVNSIEINYDTFGKKEDPAIILIQGIGTQMIVWPEEFCKAFASQGYFVVRFDNRDVGLSSKLDSAPVPNALEVLGSLQQGKPLTVPYKLSDMAKDTIGLMDALEITSAHIVGVSMGGMIAQTIAIEYPQRVKTLTSLSSTTGNPKLPMAKAEVMAILTTPPPVDLENNVQSSVKAWRVLHGSKYKFDEEFIRKRSELVFKRNFYPKGTARQFAAIFASGSRNNSLKNLKIPTLVIHGDADPLIPVEAGKDTAQSIPGSELLIIEGMGHTIPNEVGPQIIQAIIKNTKKNL